MSQKGYIFVSDGDFSSKHAERFENFFQNNYVFQVCSAERWVSCSNSSKTLGGSSVPVDLLDQQNVNWWNRPLPTFQLKHSHQNEFATENVLWCTKTPTHDFLNRTRISPVLSFWGFDLSFTQPNMTSASTIQAQKWYFFVQLGVKMIWSLLRMHWALARSSKIYSLVGYTMYIMAIQLKVIVLRQPPKCFRNLKAQDVLFQLFLNLQRYENAPTTQPIHRKWQWARIERIPKLLQAMLKFK